MREIKFRFWDKNLQKMFRATEAPYYDGEYQDFNFKVDFGAVDDEECTRWETNSDDWEVMQHTGLKDKNGVEIYEGDLVKWRGHDGKDDGGIMEVLYPDCFDSESFGSLYVPSNWEVIGDIYSNPELISSDKK